MAACRLALALALLVFPYTRARAFVLADEPSNAGLVTVTGTVLMPDGSPASGATVASTDESEDSPTVARTNDAGRFQLQGILGNGAQLHARSADGSLQTTLQVPSVAVRTAFSSPIRLTLAPALTHEVTVLSDGRPVKEARVVALGTAFKVHGITSVDGKVRLLLPATERLETLVAWHRELGVSGVRNLDDHPPQDTTRLSLLAPRPHRIHAVDLDGKGIRDLELGVNVRTVDSDWGVANEIEATHVTTNDDGTATVPWVPRDQLKYVEVKIVGSDWKIDKTDRERMSDGITTVHARRKRAVQGRLVMPGGASAEGLLVAGFGFGPGHQGDAPYARARRDSSFSLRVPSGHAYVLGVADLQWASNPWPGTILDKDTSKPAEITINVYPATPLTARVTRGSERDPVANAWVEVSSKGTVGWMDASGHKQTGRAGVRCWLRTDAHGVARAGVGKGQQEVRLRSGSWNEERTIEVTSTKPVEVEFPRPWQGQRQITGRLMSDGAPYKPSPTLVARAWSPRSPYVPLELKPEIHPDGTFKVAFDAETLCLYFIDTAQHRSGFASLGLGESSVEPAMVPTATYSGILLDDNAQPLANRPLSLYVETSSQEAVAAQQTDKAGRFRYPIVPAGVPLQLTLGSEAEVPEYVLFDGNRMFQPGEVREPVNFWTTIVSAQC
jgi:hypothetical protein